MKPDKHKQKRSQQYKKKHGPSADKETQSKSKSRSLRNEQNKPDSSSQKLAKSTFLPHSSSNQSDDDDDSLETCRSRVLPSNWERYEEQHEESDDVTSHGADFATLLQSSSSAVSQFRFADELALDEDISDKQSPACLTIEPNKLVAALACIPLHKKLNIEERYFEKEHILLFVEEAENNRRLYDEKSRQEKNEQVKMKAESSTTEEHQHHSATDVSGKFILQPSSGTFVDGNNDPTEAAEVRCLDIQSNIVQDLDDLLSGGKTSLSENTADDSYTDYKPDEPKPNLDPLLGDQNFSPLRTNSCVDIVDMDDVDNKELTEGTKMVTNIEDELDKLLSLDDEEEEEEEVDNITDVDKVISEEVKSAKEESNDLEDWLDSVLGN